MHPRCSLVVWLLALAWPCPASGEPAPPAAPEPAMRLGSFGIRHAGPVTFSPDGEMLATYGLDGISLWDTGTWKLARRVPAPGRGGATLWFAPDGSRLAAVAAEGAVVRAVDPHDGTELGGFRAGVERAYAAAFSPDGARLLVSGPDQSTAVLDAATGAALARTAAEGGNTFAAAWAPDGSRFATTHFDGIVRLWDAASGRRIAEMEGHEGHANGIVFSPDGRRIVSAGLDGVIRFWDAATGAPAEKLSGGQVIFQLAFSPDGRTLAASALDRSVQIWRAPGDGFRFVAGEPLRGHVGLVRTLAFSPDGRRLVTGGEEGLVRIWDLGAAGAAPRPAVAAAPGHQAHVMALAFSPDGATLASGGMDGAVVLWDVAAAAPRARGEGHVDYVSSVAFSPDGRMLASGGRDGAVRLWDVASGRLMSERKGSRRGGSYTVRFTPDGARVAAAGELLVRLWPVAQAGADPEEVPPPEDIPGGVADVSFSPDGRLLASSAGNHVRIWDRAAGREAKLWFAHDGGVTDVAFSPDGSVVASAGWDKTLRLVDAGAWKKTFVLAGHAQPVQSFAYSPDGWLIASADGAGEVRFWEAATGLEVLRLPARDGRSSALAFSPDGGRLATGGADAQIEFWDIGAMLGGGADAAEAPGEEALVRRWIELGAVDARVGQTAVRRLASFATDRGGAGREAVMAFLRGRLRAGPGDDPAWLATLLKELDDDRYAVREAATEALLMMGPAVEKELRGALERSGSAEVRARLEHVLGRLAGPGAETTREDHRWLRAVMALDRIGTPEAVELLRLMARGGAGTPAGRIAVGALRRRGEADEKR